MTTPDSKEFLRDVILSLVTSLWLLFHLYSFNTLLPNTLFSLYSGTNLLQILRSKQSAMDYGAKWKCNYDNVKLCDISKDWQLYCELALPEISTCYLTDYRENILNFSSKWVVKWCRFVKTLHKCQNSGGFKMSRWCRYVKTLQVYFVKMVQVQQKNLEQ